MTPHFTRKSANYKSINKIRIRIKLYVDHIFYTISIELLYIYQRVILIMGSYNNNYTIFIIYKRFSMRSKGINIRLRKLHARERNINTSYHGSSFKSVNDTIIFILTQMILHYIIKYTIYIYTLIYSLYVISYIYSYYFIGSII